MSQYGSFIFANKKCVTSLKQRIKTPSFALMLQHIFNSTLIFEQLMRNKAYSVFDTIYYLEY